MPLKQRRKPKLDLLEPTNPQQLKRHRKAVAASDMGPNQNKSGTRWNVFIGPQQRMMSAPAKSVAPVVAQLTGINASVVLNRLKSGAYHSFGENPTVTVSMAGSIKGEGILDWLTKKVGESSLFRSEPAPVAAPTAPPSSVKESFPTDTKTLFQMNQNTYDNKCTRVGDWRCMPGTKTLQFYVKGNDVIVCVRGTASFRDLMADIKITFQNVRGSVRYNEDLAAIKSFQQQYPTTRYKYYFTGHSLGGALIDEYMKDGLGTSAISFNPAVQKEFYNSTNHHRIYNTQDPLYDLMGRHISSAEVRPFQGKEQSTLDKILGYIPVVNDAAKALKGHSLDNYIGGMAQPSRSYTHQQMQQKLQELYLAFDPMGYRTPNSNPVQLAADALDRFPDYVAKKWAAASSWQTERSMADLFDEFFMLERERIKQYRKNAGRGKNVLMKRMTPAVVDRPYMRGPNMLGGFSFFDDVLKPVARFAIPAMTIGAVKADDAFKGDFNPKLENVLPYVTKTGSNLLAAKTGDPSGLIEQVADTAKGGNPLDIYRQKAIEYQRKHLNSTGQGRCRWVDKGSRFPDWQEVCN